MVYPLLLCGHMKVGVAAFGKFGSGHRNVGVRPEERWVMVLGKLGALFLNDPRDHIKSFEKG